MCLEHHSNFKTCPSVNEISQQYPLCMHFSTFIRSAIYLFINFRSFSSSLHSMPKLYFRHGAVSSAKTLNLLAVAHNYKTQGKSVVLMKVC